MLDAALILCENCGYDIGSLESRLTTEPGLRCPECGKPIAESLPERRVGSPWQQAPSFRSALTTNWLALRRPRAIWSRVTTSFAASRNLMEWNFLACSLGWALALMLGDLRNIADTPPFPLTAILAFIALNLLSLVEWLGIQWFGRRREWRISEEVAWSVVGQASVGWVFGPVLAIVTMLVAWQARWLGWGVGHRGRHGGTDYTTLMLAVGLPAGLLVFETLTYLGFRAMRFANHPRESAP